MKEERDPRDSKIYKLILRQQRELEKQICSDRRVFMDLLVYNYSSERKAEIIDEQQKAITELLKAQSVEITSFNIRDIWE